MESLVGAGSPVEITLGTRNSFLACDMRRDVSSAAGGHASINGLPGEGRHEGLVPRNDVLTGGFIRFSLARTLTRIIFLVPRLRSPRNPEGVASQEGYLRCSKRFDHIGVTLQVLALFEFKSVDERP